MFHFIIYWLIFIGILATNLGLYFLLVYLVKRYLTKEHLSLDIINGIKVGLRIFAIIFSFVTFFFMSPWLFGSAITQEFALIIATITGTIIALSTTTVIQNFIAGLYIIITRPYEIGHLIKIGDREGVVEEISLNHTKLRMASKIHHYISNKTIINSKIINYTVDKEKILNIRGDFGAFLKEALLEKEIVKYVFYLELPKENPTRTKTILKEICDKYQKIFHYPPKFMIMGFKYKVKITFVMIAEDPHLILHQKPKFIKDVYLKLFGKQEESKKTIEKPKLIEKPKKVKKKARKAKK